MGKMKTTIIYTSKHGTTAKVAKMVAERLTGNQVSVIDLKKEKYPDIHSFEGIILGTSIYAGAPSKTMQRLCKENIDTLRQKRLALFVCGMELDETKQQQELANAYPQELYEYTVTKCFAGGEFQFEKMISLNAPSSSVLQKRIKAFRKSKKMRLTGL
jgi:menaquinone-dependent protoporphyrinogen oxidase